MTQFINIGFGNIISSDKIVAIITPDSAPAKRLLQNFREAGRIVDATQGRRTRAVIITNSDYVILSALLPETISGRYKGEEDE